MDTLESRGNFQTLFVFVFSFLAYLILSRSETLRVIAKTLPVTVNVGRAAIFKFSLRCPLLVPSYHSILFRFFFDSLQTLIFLGIFIADIRTYLLGRRFVLVIGALVRFPFSFMPMRYAQIGLSA